MTQRGLREERLRARALSQEGSSQTRGGGQTLGAVTQSAVPQLPGEGGATPWQGRLAGRGREHLPVGWNGTELHGGNGPCTHDLGSRGLIWSRLCQLIRGRKGQLTASPIELDVDGNGALVTFVEVLQHGRDQPTDPGSACLSGQALISRGLSALGGVKPVAIHLSDD